MKFLNLFLIILMSARLASASGRAHTATPVSFDQVPVEALKLIDKHKYQASKVEILDTQFFILTRKENGFTQKQISTAIARAWPRWRNKFSFDSKIITFIDYDQLLGGGPLGPPAVLGIYLGEQVPLRASEIIESMLGWAPQDTAKEYILRNYNRFPDPLQSYADDMVTHQLGHLIFGYGRTVTPDNLDRWFALGLGLVYDRMIWAESSSMESPLFESTVRIWKDKYSINPEIDQRLVNPKTDADATYSLVRDQNYCHGKAWVYLRALREKLGPERFDLLVRRYVYERPKGSLIAYDDFLNSFSDSEIAVVRELEQEYSIR